ncbi:GGDEF domain-containing protein [Cryobacterium algoricola]|uniref:GGDEF domain-containing protein n=1 Tax=Cryobacterium algoricola TaxID=1259183 RepID=A0ABY2IEW6_9MICO|nr:GGDEF domain-containing protein [Cryobacterium algoricola]TFB88324.1 GGDEF domain-containing protein [Cryobacterium algoricola]
MMTVAKSKMAPPISGAFLSPPEELRFVGFQWTALMLSALLAVLTSISTFDPPSVRWFLFAGAATGVIVALRARYAQRVTVIGGVAATAMAIGLTIIVAITIQPAPMGVIMSFGLLGIAIALCTFEDPIRASIESSICAIVGSVIIVARSSIPFAAVFIFVSLVVLASSSVLFLRHSLRVSRDEAIALSLTDSLTGVSNRRGLEIRFSVVTAMAVRTGQQLGCLMIDLDRFKLINDVHGHAIGDGILKECAAVIKTCLRPSDVCARIGGEEFAVFAIVDGPAQLAIIAERIRAAIENQGTIPPVTASIGGSCGAVVESETIDALLRIADMALCAAKSAGRNIVRLGS